MTQQQRTQKLQARIDDLLSGTAKSAPGKKLSEESNRLFAPYFPDDMHRAAALAALCMKTAEEVGGIDGLEGAVYELYDCLGQVPERHGRTRGQAVPDALSTGPGAFTHAQP